MVMKKSKPSKKETKMAKSLAEGDRFSCDNQSCKKIGNCAILCEGLSCDKLTDKSRSAMPQAKWCPTQVICKPVQCGEVTCSKLKKQ